MDQLTYPHKFNFGRIIIIELLTGRDALIVDLITLLVADSDIVAGKTLMLALYSIANHLEIH